MMDNSTSPLRTDDNNDESALQETNSPTEIKIEEYNTVMEIDLTLEKTPEKITQISINDNKNKPRKLKFKNIRGEKRKFSEKSDQKKIKRKRKEEKPGPQHEILLLTPQSKPVLKKEESTPADIDSSDMETKQKSSRKSKTIANKCKDTLNVLLQLDPDVLESMDKSLKIIKSHSLLCDKYISVDVLLDLVSLALDRRGKDFEEISLSMIVSKCLNIACVTPKSLKIKKNLVCASVSPKDNLLQEEVLPTTLSSKEALFKVETPKNKNLDETEQTESEAFEIVPEKSGKNFCITNYFKKLKRTVEERDKNERFSCFTTKTDMFLAPKLGGELAGERRHQFEEEFNSQKCESNYLTELIHKRKVKNCRKEDQDSAKEPLSVIEGGIESAGQENSKKRVSLIRVDKPKAEVMCRTKAKLFQFHDNRRPPYWGTWRRKSETVGPRKPFGKDKVLNYEIDSDDEWEEEEEPGESLHGSDEEKEPEEDYEVDNDFFVPHGYLSDDENPERENMSSKIKLDLLEEQFTSEIKQKTRKMTPIVFGTFWAYKGIPCEGNLYQDLQIEKLQYVPWTTIPVVIEEEEDKINESTSEEPMSQVKKYKKKIFPNEEIPHLIKMIHGSPQNSDHLAKKFLLYWETEKITNGNRPGLTKICVQKKIKELAAWQTSQEKGKMCWQVPKETMEEFGAQIENKTLEKKPQKCFIWKFVRKAEKNPSGVGNLTSIPTPTPTLTPNPIPTPTSTLTPTPLASSPPPATVIEPEVIVLET